MLPRLCQSMCRQINSNSVRLLSNHHGNQWLLSNQRLISNQRLLGNLTKRSLSSDSVWSLGNLNHTAIAVPDLDKAMSFYRDVLNAKVSETEDLPEHGVTVCFVNLPNTKIELLYPLGENSPIAGFLKKNPGGGVHHLCLEVEDIEQTVASLKEKGIRMLSTQTKIGAHGKPVMFLHPKDCGGVLVEIEQR